MARPRSEEANRAATATTVELLLEGGVEAVTLEEVASRSGVAKSTLYRHFGSREQLMAQAAASCVVEHPTPDTGSLASDLRWLFERFGSNESERLVNALLPLLIDAARRDPTMAELVAEVIGHRRRPVLTVLRLAQLRGEIDSELDIDVAYAMLVGPFTFRRVVEQKEITPDFVEAVLAGTIAGLKATVHADPDPVLG